MMKEKSVWTDKRVEDIMGNLLILGVIIAAAIAIFGGAVFLIRHGLEQPDYRVFHGEPSDLRSIEGVISQTLNFRGRGIIQLGLMMLILTPIARVAFSVFAFYKENDRLYVAVNLIVLCFLLFSLFGGIAIK
jgi:uncharacterized membrane protein